MKFDSNPVGTADNSGRSLPSLRDSFIWQLVPGVETPGYYQMSLRDWCKSALALGNSRSLPELFSAAGCKLQFDAATIKPLIQLANTEPENFEDEPGKLREGICSLSGG